LFVIESISIPDAIVLNPYGYTDTSKPYIDFSNLPGDVILNPSGTSAEEK
jgi:hypothetical protein